MILMTVHEIEREEEIERGEGRGGGRRAATHAQIEPWKA